MLRLIKFFLFFSFVMNLIFSPFAFAQPIERIEITSSLNPVGSGARAIGMGGAFIAIADDATAASWNPGGLFQLEKPEISFVVNSLFRNEDNKFGTNPEASGMEHISKNDINYLSIAFPFNLLKRNMMLSFNYQTLYDFKRNWEFPLLIDSSGTTGNQVINYQQDGSLSALGLSYCIQIIPEFSFGLTLNIWNNKFFENNWEQDSIQYGSGLRNGNSFNFEVRSFNRYTLNNGYNLNMGTLLQLFNDKLRIGAVFKTPFRADLNHESTFQSALIYPSDPDANVFESKVFSGEEKLDMPMSYGIGLAFRFFSGFTYSLDIYRTEWGKFIRTDSQGNRFSPISGLSKDKSDVGPTYQVRMGAEYFFITERYEVPLRMGIFFDQAPAERNPDNFYGFSLGSGIKMNGFDFDLAYQYRFGNNVGASILQNLEFSQNVSEHMIYLSFIYHFGKRYFFR